MKISNPGVSILGLGISAFDRLGPESVFPNYKILSLNNSKWFKLFPDLKNKVIPCREILPNFALSKTGTKNALEELDWQALQDKLGFTHLLTYKPVKSQKLFEERTGIRILNNSFNIFEKLENKASFRRYINGVNMFPDFFVADMEELSGLNFEIIFKKFGKFVIQDSKLSGGRGTFIISDEKQYKAAIERLIAINSNEIVVSQFIRGKSSSVQVCITKYGIFSLPLQEQVINQPELVNTNLPGADSFNGGQWVAETFTEEENNLAREHVESIANRLQEIGYKGIFGIDLIVSNSKVYVIEVNARLTGMSSVIASIQKSLNQIPLIVLHILEHAEIEYELSDEEIGQIKKYSLNKKSYGYAIVFNNSSEKILVCKTIKPGLYRFTNNTLMFDSLSHSIESLDKDSFLLLDFPEKGTIISSNKRVGRILLNNSVVDREGKLISRVGSFIDQLRYEIETIDTKS